MRKTRLMLLGITLASMCSLNARGFGDSFAGTALGSFTGTVAGQAITRPRRETVVVERRDSGAAVRMAEDASRIAQRAGSAAREAADIAVSANRKVDNLVDEMNAAFGRAYKRIDRVESATEDNSRKMKDLADENRKLKKQMSTLQKEFDELKKRPEATA